MIPRSLRTPVQTLACAVLLAAPLAASAQGFFVPPSAQPGGGGDAGRATRPRPQPRPSPQLVAPGPGFAQGGPEDASGPPEGPPPPLNVPLPPIPELPPIPKGTAPPDGVIGVIDVPSIMRVSSAAQQVERVLGERRDRLNADVQKERTAWREIEGQLQAQRGAQSPDQIRAKERDLQERVTNAQKQWRERLRIMQEAQQYALAQIERTLIAIIRQVADSRGMNLVLHRGQVALNVNGFDITEVAAGQVNKALPSVLIPPDGMPALAFAQSQPAPPPKPATAAPATAANAPAPTTPTPPPAPAPAPKK